MAPTKLMLVAGEASGDTLGAELASAMKQLMAGKSGSAPQFFGAGGARMAAAGVELDLDMTAHAVVGIWEVLKNYGKFKGFFDHLLRVAIQKEPDVIVLIDYPGFNLRFARAVRKHLGSAKTAWKPLIVYYVSPQIWAWHESRVYQIAADMDLLLSIFPFEKAWYAARVPEFPVEFVGHPIVDRYSIRKPSGTDPRLAPVNQQDLPPLIVLLPGSRERELRKHLPVMLEAARIVRKTTKARVQVVVPPGKLPELAGECSAQAGVAGVEITIGHLPEALASASAAMACSGTVTLECAWFGVPSVVLYRTSWSTYLLGRRFIKVKYIAMPNLLADEGVYPELIQGAATPEALARECLDFLNNPGRRSVVLTKLDRIIRSLGEPGASTRAAKAIIALASQHKHASNP